ncbi:MAG: bifunctional phosphopantothenoylcysteine decarboxylase/phosphopantothenate--cysteine ligase CoaBC [Anaerolineae bacterium]|nr:bifunctional phosphopantothenoylcysteine decarboxylase/phosphopantothenate--cysteine ligase CoaBC [Anaerolineae bacterium]
MQTITLLKDKRIILAATGSIAVYKAVDLASKLTQVGALVDVIMTDSAQRFVAPITFKAVTGRAVYTDMWQADNSGGLPTHIAHVGLGEGADLMAVVPATANTIAKLATGIADNLLTVTALAARCPLLIAPAMDGGMYEHPATQANIETLLKRGAYLVEPEEGRFASGLIGRGRLPDTQTLIGHIRLLLAQNGALHGNHVVVTAGGTREALDPVRFIGNHSSGKQGYALAQAALDVGAKVTLISTVDLPTPIGAKLDKVDSAESMLEAVLHYALKELHRILIMSAAVADFRPATRSVQKIKKKDDDSAPTLVLERTADILQSVKAARDSTIDRLSPSVVVGFAAESENLLNNARIKLERKGLDLIVANDITATDAGFASDYNRVVILDRDGGREEIERQSKTQISERVIERVADILTQRA